MNNDINRSLWHLLRAKCISERLFNNYLSIMIFDTKYFLRCMELINTLNGLIIDGDADDMKTELTDSFDSLNVKDTLVSTDGLLHLQKENHALNRKLSEHNHFCREYTAKLHKMIMLLQRQNSILSENLNSNDLSCEIRSLSLSNPSSVMLDELRAEEAHVKQSIREQQAQLMSIHDNNLQTLVEHEKILNSRHEDDAVQISLLQEQLQRNSSALDEISTQKQHLQLSLSETAESLQEKDKVINTLRNKLLSYENLLQSHEVYNSYPEDNGRPSWVVDYTEISITNTVLGTGAWGRVSLGSFRGLTVAVKELHSSILSPHNQNKFLREMGISSKIRHPHILQFICCSQNRNSCSL